MFKLENRWTDFNWILYRGSLRKVVQKFQLSFKQEIFNNEFIWTPKCVTAGSLYIHWTVLFRTKIVQKNEAHIFCRTHFLRNVLWLSGQLNKRNVMNTFSNIQTQQATMASTTQSGLRKNKLERSVYWLRTELKSDLFCSLNVVLYYNTASQHILNSLYIFPSALWLPEHNRSYEETKTVFTDCRLR
jgi:hypothetical protein